MFALKFGSSIRIEELLHVQVFANELSDDFGEDVSMYFYDLPDTEKKRGQYIFPTPGTGSLRIFNLPEVFSKAGLTLESSAYLYPGSLRLI